MVPDRLLSRAYVYFKVNGLFCVLVSTVGEKIEILCKKIYIYIVFFRSETDIFESVICILFKGFQIKVLSCDPVHNQPLDMTGH